MTLNMVLGLNITEYSVTTEEKSQAESNLGSDLIQDS